MRVAVEERSPHVWEGVVGSFLGFQRGNDADLLGGRSGVIRNWLFLGLYLSDRGFTFGGCGLCLLQLFFLCDDLFNSGFVLLGKPDMRVGSVELRSRNDGRVKDVRRVRRLQDIERRGFASHVVGRHNL